jgi:eukaryotic-like serine/threonine-protein kinase
MLPETLIAPRLTFGPFTFDRGSRLLRRGEDLVSLPPRVVAVLELLLERAGDIVPRQELIDSVWKDAFVTDTSLAEAVSFLRQSLGDDSQAPGYIQTVHRRGYRFIAPVTPHLRAEAEPVRVERDAASSERVSPSIPRQLLPWSVAALSLATAAAAVWHLAARSTAAPPGVRFEVVAPAGTEFDSRAPALAVAPGGSHLVWSGCAGAACRLYVRAIDRIEATPLAGTDGAAAPFVSPDGRWIGFFAGGKLRKVGIRGGAPVPLADSADALGGAWTPDGRIIFAGARLGLTVVGENGGDARPLTVPQPRDGEVRHAWPSLAADGATLLFTVLTAASGDNDGRIAIMRAAEPAEPRSWKTILDGATRAHAIGGDAIVFSRGAELAGIGFDPIRMAVFGAAHSLVTGFGTPDVARSFSASWSGTLAYVSAEQTAAVDYRWLVASAVSPDATRLAAAVADGTRTDLWVASLDSGAATRLTHDGINGAPVWAPDGRSLFFAKRVNGSYEIWTRDADAASAPTRVLAADGHAVPLSSSASGHGLLFSQATAESGLDIWMMPAAGGSPRPLVRTAFDETAAVLSPDGRFVAYQSNESGRWDVHLMRLGDGRRAVVSPDGGVAPAWEREGLRIRYRAGARSMVASMAPGAELRVLPPSESAERDRPVPVAMDAGGRVRFDAVGPPRRRAIASLSFDRELRQLLGPQPGAMPR